MILNWHHCHETTDISYLSWIGGQFDLLYPPFTSYEHHSLLTIHCLMLFASISSWACFLIALRDRIGHSTDQDQRLGEQSRSRTAAILLNWRGAAALHEYLKKVWSKISFHWDRNKIIIQNFLINILVIHLTQLPLYLLLPLALPSIFLSFCPAPCPGLTAAQVLGLFFNHYLHLIKPRILADTELEGMHKNLQVQLLSEWPIQGLNFQPWHH